METIKNRLRFSLSGVISGLALAAAVLLGTTFGANALLKSEIYSKSRLVTMIVSQDNVGIVELVQDSRNLDMMLKFVGALTSAYINFELIPVNEVGTFAAVFESVQGEVTIEKFEYHRKNLSIHGSTPTRQAYEDFVERLRDTEYFQQVTGHEYTAVDDSIQFELECDSQSVPVYLDFSG